MKNNKLAMLVAMVAGGLAASAEAAVIAEYRFATNTNFTAKDANVTASALTGGASTVVERIASVTPNYATAPFAVARRTNNTSADHYFQFVVTAAPGYELDLSDLQIDLSLGGAATPRTVDWRTSVDGLSLASPSFGFVSLTAVRPNTQGYSYDLSAEKYQNLSSITFRGYIATPDPNQNIDIDNIVLNGSAAVAVIPEPGAAVGLVGAAGLLVRRRR